MFKSLGSYIKMMSLPQLQAETYCKERRFARFEQYGGRVRFLKLHTVAHYCLIPLLKVQRKLKKVQLIIIRDSRKKTDRPVLYCPTHIGGMDVEISFEAIKDPCWLLLGDPREIYKDGSGLMLQMNGVIPLHTEDKKDRSIAKKQMEVLLKKGGSLLIFPEGAWNISANSLLNYLYSGAVELAITCNADIVPIAIEWRKNTYYCVIGENISYSDNTFEERYELTDELRDQMAALKWEIIEKLPSIKRKDIVINGAEMIDEIPFLNTEYTWNIDEVLRTQFHPRNVTAPKAAYSFYKQLIPGSANAFLFNSRITGRAL